MDQDGYLLFSRARRACRPILAVRECGAISGSVAVGRRQIAKVHAAKWINNGLRPLRSFGRAKSNHPREYRHAEEYNNRQNSKPTHVSPRSDIDMVVVVCWALTPERVRVS